MCFYIYTRGVSIQRWFPNGVGVPDGTSLKCHEGNIYTKVYSLPSLATVKYIRGFHLIGNSSLSPDTTVAGTIRCYYNMSDTPAWTKQVTYKELKAGYWSKEINKNNINFIQFELEYDNTQQIGSQVSPSYFEVEYADENRINK